MVLAATLAGCAGGPVAKGPVRVLYAASLTQLFERQIGPAFTRHSGYSYQGYAGGSEALAAEVRGRVLPGDVFVSASPAVNDSLMPRWVSFYVQFARVSLVVAYNPKSRFVADFAHLPWYRVLAMPGIRVGRTDPRLDPKGALTLTALRRAAVAYHDPQLPTRVLARSEVFPEEELLGRLDAGQLDAGFFYTDEAVAQHLPTVGLGLGMVSATFTVTVLRGAPDPAGAAAFVNYLLGPLGRAALRSAGFSVLPVTVFGTRSAVPAALRERLGLG